jgi:hypothetical protein
LGLYGDMMGGKGDEKDNAKQHGRKGKPPLASIGSSDLGQPGRLLPHRDGTICETPRLNRSYRVETGRYSLRGGLGRCRGDTRGPRRPNAARDGVKSMIVGFPGRPHGRREEGGGAVSS